MNTQEFLIYRFGDFELQPRERRLLQAGKAVSLTPKAFEVLCLLVERPGRAITRDEVMATIWPGRIIAESNLTKHIWALRQALGEREDDSRFIETLPKLGYRFVAPVSRAEAPPLEPIPVSQTRASLPDAAPTAQPEPSASIPADSMPQATSLQMPSGEMARSNWWRFKTRPTALAAAGVVAVAAVIGLWWWNANQAALPWPQRQAGRALAIFDFRNLTRNAKHDWIGTAFPEMLGIDMVQGGQLHLLPGELIHTTRGNEAQPGAGGFSPDRLSSLRRRLAVDYVVTGSYLASGENNARIRLDLTMQDADSGATLAVFTRNGSVENLPALVSKASEDLRKNLNVRPESTEEQRLAANAQPPSTDVMRRIGIALAALQRYDPARARDELLQAIAGAPDYAPSYMYLAQAWSKLGYNAKALVAAKQAAARAADLPQIFRLQIDVQNFRAQFDWPKAIATLRQLAVLQPNDPETQLELAHVLLAAGKPKESQDVLEKLRGQGNAIPDPRIELAEANIAKAQDNAKARIAHAQKALQLAQARGAIGLKADAELALGSALPVAEAKTAKAMLEEALADYRSAGNPRGEASAHINLGNLLSDTEPKRARAEYQAALATSQTIGDQDGIAAAYSDLAIALWASGDKDSADIAVRNVLRIRRETGDIAGQAWALTALAIAQSDESASDESIANFREAASLAARAGAHAHRGFTLFSLADILRLRGEFEQAHTACTESQSEYASIKDIANRNNSDLECALISLDRGNTAAAISTLVRARKAAEQSGDTTTLVDAAMTQGQIAMGEGRWDAAIALLGGARKRAASSDLKTAEAIATSLLALCYSRLGKTVERDAAIKHAAKLRGTMTERQEVLQVDVALLELRGETGDGGQALSQLEAIATDARRRQWPGWALEAGLAESRLLEKTGQAGRARALRTQIADEAGRLGFRWIAQRATSV